MNMLLQKSRRCRFGCYTSAVIMGLATQAFAQSPAPGVHVIESELNPNGRSAPILGTSVDWYQGDAVFSDVGNGFSGLASGSLDLSTGVNVNLGLLQVTQEVVGVGLGTYTRIDNTDLNNWSIAFGTDLDVRVLGSDSIGTVLDGLVDPDLGITPQWGARVDFADIGLDLDPNSTYEVNFSVFDNSGLLTGVDANLLDTFDYSVGTTSAGTGDGLLGLTNLTNQAGQETLRFTTGDSVDGLGINFGATSLLSSSTGVNLLNGIASRDAMNSDLYRISNFEVSEVPEPGVLCFLPMALLIGGFNRKRR